MSIRNIFSMREKRAQIWSLDLMVAFVIFTIGLVVIFFYAINYRSTAFDTFEELYFEADLASTLLLTDEVSGIVSSGKINQTKLDNFDSLSESEKKSVLGVSNYFYFSFSDMKVNGSLVSEIGVVNTSMVDNQIKITRISIYENRPIKFEIIFWK